MVMRLVLAFAFGPPACQAPDHFSRADREASYLIVRETCLDEGAAPFVCEAMTAIAWRESRGVPHSVHTRGRNEHGLGLFGHSPKFWGWALPPGGSFCSPIDATRALLAEFRYAVRRGADTVRDLQRVHSGRSPRDDSRPHRDNRWCYLIEHGPRDDRDIVSWQVDCDTPVAMEDLGHG